MTKIKRKLKNLLPKSPNLLKIFLEKERTEKKKRKSLILKSNNLFSSLNYRQDNDPLQNEVEEPEEGQKTLDTFFGGKQAPKKIVMK